MKDKVEIRGTYQESRIFDKKTKTVLWNGVKSVCKTKLTVTFSNKLIVIGHNCNVQKAGGGTFFRVASDTSAGAAGM